MKKGLIITGILLAVSLVWWLLQLDPPLPPPPQRTALEGASLLFNGRDLGSWEEPTESAERHWAVDRESIVALTGRGDLATREEYSDFRLELDFLVPGSSGVPADGSSVFLNGRYEIRIGPPGAGQPAGENRCGAIPGLREPEENACSPAGTWQSLQVVFLAARFRRGLKISPARATLFLNGITIHDNLELPGPTPGGFSEDGSEGALLGPFRLHAGGHRVRFANLWLRPLSDEERVFYFPEPRAPAGKEWLDMDYGPFLTASIEAPWPGRNIAYKGIALRMDEVYGSGRDEAVVFDTDLLRYSVGWKGDFVELKGVAFDGTHQTHPAIAGEPFFANPRLPGWASAGSFEDPRELPYGPLPRDWGHYQGLYLHRNRVIFSYSVGSTEVLEMPGLEFGEGGLAAFSRVLNVGPSREDLMVQVASVPDARRSIVSLDTLKAAGGQGPATGTLALLEREGRTTAAAVSGAPPDSRWLLSDQGDIRLRIAASPRPVRMELKLWSGAGGMLPSFAKLAAGSGEPTDLRPLTRGGPARWRSRPRTAVQQGSEEAPYTIDTLSWPEENPWNSWLRFGGFDFFADGARAAICTWNGDVWLVDGIGSSPEELTWQRIATGLFQPLGLKVVDEQIYVLGRDQITILHDLNGDGESDFYQNFNNDHQVSEHFHEFAMDLQLGPDGDFYYMKGGRHALDAVIPQHGTLIRVSRDGSESQILANGFRAPNGLCITPDGRFFSSDQQGHWVPANRINLIRPGGFYGYRWSYFPGEKPTSYDSPLAWIHPSVDRSPSTFVWVDSQGWGPFQDRLISLSYGMGKLDLVLEEETQGTVQGGLTRFPLDFETGVMRGRFRPADGQLYLAGLYGWAGNKTRPGGFYRVRYTGKPVHMPTGLQVASDGVVITFTGPLQREAALDTGNYHVQVWNYQWSERYGSPDFGLTGREGRDQLRVESVALSADARRVFLKLPDITPVMQMHVDINLQAADGSPLRTFLHNTIHRLGDTPGLAELGEGWVSGVDRAQPELVERAPGLIQEIRSVDSEPLEADARRSRLAALYVPAGEPVSVLLPAGRFRSRWRGFLESTLNQRVRFHLQGRGQARLRINGKEVLEAAAILGDSASPPVDLLSGSNRLELDYQSPVSGDAVIRLEWSSEEWAPEPLPPDALIHDPRDPALRNTDFLREGLRLFEESRCLHCHQPEQGLAEGGVPESGSPAISLERVGERLRAGWLIDWIADPESVRTAARMPAVLPGSRQEVRAAAAEITAFLLRGRGGSIEPQPRLEASQVAVGERLFENLGCRGCHFLAGDAPSAGRSPLRGLSTRWRYSGLVRYLLRPQAEDPLSPMPDFGLSPSEAQALAQFLFSRSESRAGTSSPEALGDPARGKARIESLGCLNCHPLPGFESKLAAPSLEDLLGKTWATGCLASAGSPPSSAPRFSFDSDQRAALRNFLENHSGALARRDWIEFAEHQIEHLGCVACHDRDSAKARWTPGDSGSPGSGHEGEESIHLMIPSLTWAGEKLQPGWVESLLFGALRQKARPRLFARMPAFPGYARGVARGLAQGHGYSPDSLSSGPSWDPAAAAVGKLLIEPGALGCVQCHPVGSRPALAGPDTETIEFHLISRRLRYPFYQRLLLDPQRVVPGTMMPRFIDRDGTTGLRGFYQGSGRKQADALWLFSRGGP